MINRGGTHSTVSAASYSERKRLRRRRGAALVVCAIALFVPISVAWASVTNYVDTATFNDLDWGQTPGTANRTYNELWRPSGYYFKLFYSNDTTGKGGTENPLVDPRDWASAHAACQNQSGANNISPVTCQTDGA